MHNTCKITHTEVCRLSDNPHNQLVLLQLVQVLEVLLLIRGSLGAGHFLLWRGAVPSLLLTPECSAIQTSLAVYFLPVHVHSCCYIWLGNVCAFRGPKDDGDMTLPSVKLRYP